MLEAAIPRVDDPLQALEAERNQLRVRIETEKDTPRVHELLRQFQDLTRQINAGCAEAA